MLNTVSKLALCNNSNRKPNGETKSNANLSALISTSEKLIMPQMVKLSMLSKKMRSQFNL